MTTTTTAPTTCHRLHGPPVVGEVVIHAAVACENDVVVGKAFNAEKDITVELPGGGATSMGLAVSVPLYPDCGNSALTPKFVSRGYQDTWAAVAFGLFVVAQVLVSAICNALLPNPTTAQTTTDDARPVDEQINHRLVFNFSTFAALPLSFLMVGITLAVMRRHPTMCIICSCLLIAVALAGAALVAHVHLEADRAVVALLVVLAILQFVRLYALRGRIPSASVLLSHSTSIVVIYPGVVAVGFLCSFAFLFYGMLHLHMMAPTVRTVRGMLDQQPSSSLRRPSHNELGEMSSGGGTNSNLDWHAATSQWCQLGIYLLMLFWAAHVCVNVAHVTASGTVATWYFGAGGVMPRNPSAKSFLRAVTTSFGSICFGSLILGVLQCAHAVVQGVACKQQGLVACVALCFVAMLEMVTRYFNVYALTHMAIYGSGFMEASKRTWALVHSAGVTAIINDYLANTPLDVITAANALLLGTAFYGATDSLSTGLSVGVAAYVVHAIALRSVYSGIVTLFVCFAESPTVAEGSHPALYRAMMESTEAASRSFC